MKYNELASVQTPDLVKKAIQVAERLGFSLQLGSRSSACIPEVGQLLRTLAAACPGGRIGEHGAGAGVGTAWLVSGLAPAATLISAEIDPSLAAAASRLFADYANVQIRQGDWHVALADEKPFDLLFMDAAPEKDLLPENWNRVTKLVKVGGQIVLDDLTPLELWPSEWKNKVDLKRRFAFENPRVVSVEVRTTAKTAALMITRVR